MTYSSSFETDATAKNDGTFLNAGLFSIMNLYEGMGLADVVNENLHVRSDKGYSDSDHVLSQVLMQIGGGSALDHLDYFDETFSTENCDFDIPSPSAARDYMNNFHNADEDKKRGYGESFVPKENEHLKGFAKIHNFIFKQIYKLKPVSSITLDQDATFINTDTKGTLRNYHGDRSYEALNVYCPEYDVMVATQFRDGNVSPGYGQLEQLKEVVSNIPEGVKEVSFRSDTAGYQTDLLNYCAVKDEERRFPVINFTVSCPVGKEFKQAVKTVPTAEWKRVCRKKNGKLIPTKLECAEVVYVPNSLCKSKNDPEYRFIATREIADISVKKTCELSRDEQQLELDLEIEKAEKENENIKKIHLTAMCDGKIYKVFGIVTNMLERDIGELVLWHHGRCGKSEEVHHILKDELAGGHIISKRFGANAAYWNISVIALSLNNIFKNNFLPEECRKSRPKTLRFLFYNMAGRFVKHAHKIVLKLFGSITGKTWYIEAMRRMEECFSLA